MSELPSRDAIPAEDAAPEASGRWTGHALLGLMRPKQWMKNALLFAALIFAKELFVWKSLALAGLGFASFCLASSSVYVVNDLLDAERDRLHPEKRYRPIASGEVGAGAAAALAAVLTTGALLLAWWIGPMFGLWVVIYVALTHFYSLAGKNIVILDAMLIASGFVIRAVAGAVAIGVPSSDWFILCTLFLAVFLALSKRKAEMLAMNEAASRARPVLEKYTRSTLTAFTATSMAAVLLCYALYVRDFLEQKGAGFQLLELTVPFVLFGVFRYHLLVERGILGERPEEVILLDRPIQICLAGFILVAVTALYLVG